MRLHSVFRVLLVIVAATVSVTASAQGRWYTVELVLFSNTDPSSVSDYSWRADPALPDTTFAVPLSLPSERVTPLGPNSHQLAGIWQELRVSGQYQPLRHIAWRQIGTSASRAPLVQLGDDPDANVYGTVKMVRSRFIHLELDLLVRDERGRYRIEARRKMSPNELHYIDHPMVGILARVTRY